MDNDDAIVTALMLLFDGRTEYDAKRLLMKAITPRSKRTKFVCTECDGSNLSWRSDCEWRDDLQDWNVIEWDSCWCGDCEREVSDERVHIDWAKPEEPEENPAIKPSGDTQVT